MLRLAGFVAGSATAIGLILAVLGIPELHPTAEPPVEVVASLPEPQRKPHPAPEPIPEPEPELAPEPVAAAIPDPGNETGPQPLETHWHSFWSPFGSRIAAEGFVGRLESVTGFDYRVVKIDNGAYEVAFAYSDDAERDAMLNTIASATGLELPDS